MQQEAKARRPGTAAAAEHSAQRAPAQDMHGSAPMQSQAQTIDRLFGPAVQRKRTREAEEQPPVGMRQWIDPARKDKTPVAYAEAQYAENKARALKILLSIIGSLEKNGPDGDTRNAGRYEDPDRREWEVIPELGAPIRKYGVKIEYNHRTLKNDAGLPVRYQSTFKRNEGTGKIEMVANDNRAPKSSDKGSSRDPLIGMNLNQIWANQLLYFLKLEAAAAKDKEAPLQPAKLHSVKRSQIENPSTLATYWITTKADVGVVDDTDDWLALSGSPNGNALLYLILQSPELGESLDADTLKRDPASLYEIEVTAGPAFTFK